MDAPTDLRRIDALLAIMARLRDAERGCPWDLEQTFKTIAPYTIEEAYEVADAIERNDMAALKDELGDLLFQTVFHSQMASEAGAFTFADVVEAISRKNDPPPSARVRRRRHQIRRRADHRLGGTQAPRTRRTRDERAAVCSTTYPSPPLPSPAP